MINKAAPKDPEKNRPFFYIMKDKEIFLQKDTDGVGKTFIYEDFDRLVSSAKITGNITDESMLDLLRTTEGFRKLVHSIGVSIECEDRDLDGHFVFQMYANKDKYKGGTDLILDQKADGAEQRVYLSETKWKDDDKEPGQIRFECQRSGIFATVSVRFYLNDGFTAPEYVEDEKVDTASPKYRSMIERSLVNRGDLTRLKRAIKKAKDGEDVSVAFIGGSITQGAGATPINENCYAYKTYRYFADTFGKCENVHFVKAGIGGTPSELGVVRFERDVLRYGTVPKPDIVVVEFAVNDEGDETQGVCFESLVRKALMLDNEPAVLIMFSVFADDYNLQDRLSPVGFNLNLPMVSVKDAVVPQFYDKENKVISKRQFFYDIFHPTSLGHSIMADGIINLFDIAAKDLEENGPGTDGTPDLLLKDPAIGKTFEKVFLFDKKDTYDGAKIDEGSFTLTDNVLQSVEIDTDLSLTPMFPYNYMYDGKKDDKKPCFTLNINSKALMIVMKDSGDVDAACADAYVDGKHVRKLDPHVNNWLHCNALIIYSEDESADHTVEIRIDENDIDKKFTILGFGVVK